MNRLIIEAIDNAKALQADNLRTTNNLIATTRQMEDNEKVVNGIYLATVSRGIYSLNPIQVASLENIIYQCPLAGGGAIFKARSLYTLHAMQLWYNDDSLCNLVNMEWRNAQPIVEKKDGLQVYPNPTTGEITFDFINAITEKQLLYIYNLQGQVVFQKEIEAELSKLTISFPNITKGIYLYRVEGTKAHTGKIILE